MSTTTEQKENSPRNRSAKTMLFGLVTLACLVIAVVYVMRSAQNVQPDMQSDTAATAELSQSNLNQSATPTSGKEAASVDSPLAVAAVSPLVVSPLAVPPNDSAKTVVEATLPSEPFFVSLNLRDGSDIGKVRVATVAAPDSVTWIADLRCERVYFAGGKGICLRRVIENISAYSVATIFDSNFHTLSEFKVEGLPSRARMSPDGRYAAFTLFVFGHSYADDNFSTATYILDSATGQPLANLEEFTVFQDGEKISFPDFNYWGVTFRKDSNIFYATLRFNRTPYLVQGDISARTVKVLHPGVECPSLSPDETRVAFKNMVARADWRLSVLDLKTLVETPLAGTINVDDQAEWLDNEHLLFAATDPELPAARSLMVVQADGGGSLQRYASATESPAIVRY